MATYERLSGNQFGEAHIDMLKSLKEHVNWSVEGEGNSLFFDILVLIRIWSGPFPDFGEIFRPREMDWLLTTATRTLEFKLKRKFIDFVISSGYKDKPEIGKDGKPALRRQTPVLREGRRMLDDENYTVCRNIVPDLFKIYDAFEVNYRDDRGYTHLQVACQAGANDALKGFLEHGHDPNDLSFEPPLLHLAMTHGHKQVIETLLRAGADPNSPNGDGETPLHVACADWESYRDTAKFFLDSCAEMGAPLDLDALNKAGWRVLHRAFVDGNWDLAELLLRRGADPNAADYAGRGPLHVICGRDYRDRSMEPFFWICDEMDKGVLVDGLSHNGERPLQMAVTNLRPDQVDILLDRGANLKKLVFPTYENLVQRHFHLYAWTPPDVLLRLVAGAVGVVECLEKRKYVLRPEDAFAITKFFTRIGAFAKKKDAGLDDENFVREAKKLSIQPDLSLHDLILLRVEEAAERLTYRDYYEFACSSDESLKLLPSRDTCARHLCEKASRGFFRRWAEFALSRNGAREDGLEEMMNADLSKVFVKHTLRAMRASSKQ